MCSQACGTCKAPQQGGHVLQLQQVMLGGSGNLRHQLHHPILLHVYLQQQGQLLHLQAGISYAYEKDIQSECC